MENEIKTGEASIRSQFAQYSFRNLPRFLKYPLVLKILSKVMCYDEVLDLIDQCQDISNLDLVNRIISYIGLSVSYKNIEKIPPHGRLLVVANHPLGAADVLLMLQCVGTSRKDIKVVVNKDAFGLLKNIQDLYIPVDKYTTFNADASKQIIDNLQEEKAVIIFPAGGISILTIKGVRDRNWKKGVILFSKEQQTNILPVFIEGRSSLIYLLCPRRFRRFLVMRDLLHPPRHNVKIVIGELISFKELLKETDLTTISSRLESIVYNLGTSIKFA
jgi:putative hemolysin